jgi:sodium/potassium-transporting ATPase subunit beta
MKNCSYEDPTTKTESCYVDFNEFGACTSENYYGYKDGTPCIFLKLKKAMNWVPKPFTNFPAKLPLDLQYEIEHTDEQKVWISCKEYYQQGGEPGSGVTIFYPDDGYPSYYFPYMGQKDYLEPLIAIQFLNPARE